MPMAASAQITKEDYLRQLSRPEPAAPAGPATRGIVIPADQPTRQIILEPGREEAIIQEKKALPKVSIRVPFEYDSAVLTDQGRTLLVPLAEAIKDAQLSSSRFLVAGHTDARGSDAYNNSLSERRAKAVREFLIQQHKIVPERLVSMGFGKRDLAEPSQPEAGVNRRVEIVALPSAK
jgi:outer membrane protein OmpA-like peptidoglycan-associated protein